MHALAAALAVCVASAEMQAPPTQHDGLTVALHADSSTAMMGAAVVFHITLAFDSSSASQSTRILDRYSGSCEFIFVNAQTGESFQRLPYASGMPDFRQPGNLVSLKHGGRTSLDDVTVHLLAENGEQIPPGRCLVSVVYANDGGNGMEACLDSSRQYQERRYAGPWSIWSGRIQSQAIDMTVRPVSAVFSRVAVPTTLEINTTHIEGQIGWRPAADSTISVQSRPGFALGNRWHLQTVVDGVTVSEYPSGLGLPERSGWSFLPPNVSSQVRLANGAELILHMEVFESSVQSQHMWMPEEGVFQVLWQGQARYTFRSGSK